MSGDYWLDQRYDDAVHAELDRLRAEVERMRPVIEAARALYADWDDGHRATDAHVADMYQAVAALDAGEPPQ